MTICEFAAWLDAGGGHRRPEAQRRLALSLVREHYRDFGPTLAAEMLEERHGCVVSRETLRHWMVADELWTARKRRRRVVHQPRRRRDCLGELVQIDGSEQAWFEDRGDRCTLLAFIDDATSRALHLRFVSSESTFAYFRSVRAYLTTHGKPARSAWRSARSCRRPSCGMPWRRGASSTAST